MTMIRKNQPEQSDVHVDATLTDYSSMILQDESEFIADRVFPTVSSGKQSNKYRTYPRGWFLRNGMRKRADATETEGIDYQTSTDNFYCDVWGLHHDIGEQTESNSDEEMDLDFEATTLLTHQALLNRDVEWATNFFTQGVWGTDLTPSTLWDAASSDPLGDIATGRQTIKQNTGKYPNVAVMGEEVWTVLKNHPDLVGRIDDGQTSGPARVLLQNLANLIEVDQVLVGGAIQNTAVEGASDSMSFVFGKHMLLLHVAPTPGRYTASAGYTFTWNGYTGASRDGMRMSRIDAPLRKARRIEIESAYDQKLISADLGYLLDDVIS